MIFVPAILIYITLNVETYKQKLSQMGKFLHFANIIILGMERKKNSVYKLSCTELIFLKLSFSQT